jgi:hypothetical protein
MAADAAESFTAADAAGPAPLNGVIVPVTPFAQNGSVIS